MNQNRDNVSQRERMLAGLPYKPWLDGLPEARERAQRLCYEYNHLPPERWGERESSSNCLERLDGSSLWSRIFIATMAPISRWERIFTPTLI